jgi:dTDP-4-dehydrorhamnose 3,5-epimerase
MPDTGTIKREGAMVHEPLPGCRLISLTPHVDSRGVFTELYREEWGQGWQFVQWNAVVSRPNVLRGVHVHLIHADYLTLIQGDATINLKDLRPGSPSYNQVAMVRLTAEVRQAIYIVPGVAHAFYFHEPSVHVYAVSRYWDGNDDLGCRFDDPDLEMVWPTAEPDLSPRDAALPSLASIRRQMPAYQPTSESAELPFRGSQRTDCDD